ncbi:MAG: hypothetical protein DRO88_01165 [Promethearchaeia archaeon]|nr:MAG: hypothetical protein DRO88_01165 [Candidatus Lokiarchaeia archaeon]
MRLLQLHQKNACKIIGKISKKRDSDQFLHILEEIQIKGVEKSKIIIIKLGGSLITDKSIPFSVNQEILDRISMELKKYSEQSSNSIIVVHGGGSFGHPLAHKYALHKGYSVAISNQIEGLLKTHYEMIEMNQLVVNTFFSHQLKAYSVPPSVVFLEHQGHLKFSGKSLLEELMKWQVIPVLFGDIQFTTSHNFKILSGDTIIQRLCEEFGAERIQKAIFTFDQDGILEKSGESQQFRVIPSLTASQLRNFDSFNINEQSAGKFDVTGSMKGKIEKILKIVDLDIIVKIINGKRPNCLLNTLFDREKLSTTIKKGE